MRKHFAKLTAIIMAAAMMLSLVPAAFAADTTTRALNIPDTKAELDRFFVESADGARLKAAQDRFVLAANAPAPADYNEHDVALARDFLEQETNGIKNGLRLNPNYDPNDPSTFSGDGMGYAFNESGRISQVFMLFTLLQGDMRLDGCTDVGSVTVYYANLSSLSIANCPALTELDISYNSLMTEIDMSTAPNIASLIAQNNTGISELDISNLTELVSLYAWGTPITSLDCSNSPHITQLSLSNTRVSELNLDGVTGLEGLYLDNTLLTDCDFSENGTISGFSAAGGETYTHIKLSTVDSEGGGLGNVRSGEVLELTAVGNGGVGITPYYGEGGGLGSIAPKSETRQIFSLIAYPSFGAEFTGWYLNGELYSNEPSLNDYTWGTAITLEARFEGGVPMTAGAANDIHSLRIYLNYYCEVDGNFITHGQAVSPDYDSNDFTTWGDVAEWNDNNRISRINFDDRPFQGPVDIIGMTELETFTMNGCSTSGVTFVDCTGLKEFYGNNSNIVLYANFIGTPNLEVVELSDLPINQASGEWLRTLDLSDCTGLTSLICLNTYLGDIILSDVHITTDPEMGRIGCTLDNGTIIAYADTALTSTVPFSGWYCDGMLYSSDNPCEVTDTDIVLTACFGEQSIPGDINEDGAVTIDDALLLMRHVLRLCTFEQAEHADMNGDGEINMTDVLMLHRAAFDA